eukprot:765121-Hanusia_phi.AAC.4
MEAERICDSRLGAEALELLKADLAVSNHSRAEPSPGAGMGWMRDSCEKDWYMLYVLDNRLLKTRLLRLKRTSMSLVSFPTNGDLPPGSM